jgi:hypothetical protein
MFFAKINKQQSMSNLIKILLRISYFSLKYRHIRNKKVENEKIKKMKTKMNKIIVFVIISFLCGNTFAQNEAKNVIRVGAGVNVVHNSNGKYQIGPALIGEYQRTLSKYVGLTADIAIEMINYRKHHDSSEIFGAVGTMFTPFPNKFKWIKLGVDLSFMYCESLLSAKT